MKNNIIIIVILFCSLFSWKSFGQSVFGPDTANYKVYVQKFGSGTPVSHTSYSNNLVPIGNNGSYKSRVFYQWNIPDNLIPDNSQIDTAEIIFEYIPVVSNYYISIYYSNVGGDLQSTSASTLWDKTSNGAYTIGQGYGNKYGYQGVQLDTVTSVFLSNSDFNNAIRDSLPNDRFTLGITALTENFQYAWNIYNSSLTLRIVYTPPQKTVTIDQKLSTGSHVGKIRVWEGSAFGSELSVPQNIPFPISSTHAIKGDQSIYSNQKYSNWTRNGATESDILNHHSFFIQSNDNNFTSNFAPAYSGITVENSLESVLSNAGNIQFKDPWFIDYPDPNYGNTKRNRGTSAPFVSRTSPFNPDYSTSYNGNTYKGIFLNQSGPGQQWAPPYYSIQAISPQTIHLSQTGKDHKFYFQNWSGTNATFQDADATSTGVVFTNSNASAQAVFKGTQLSNNANAFVNNDQRKFLNTRYDGHLHLVYESMGHIWYEMSSDNGSTWQLMNNGKPIDDGTEAKSPSMAVSDDDSDVFIVYQEENSGDYKIMLKKFNAAGQQVYSEVVKYVGKSYSEDAAPVISISNPYANGTKVMIVWRENYISGFQPGGVYYRFGKEDGYGQFDSWLIYDTKINGTDGDASYPAMTALEPDFYLVWEDNSSIKYCTLSVDAQDNITISSIETPSSGNGLRCTPMPGQVFI